MPYTVTQMPLEGVLVLEPKVFGDARGFFFESFNARDFEQATVFDVVIEWPLHLLDGQPLLATKDAQAATWGQLISNAE
jgi:dTDP-4-dehydrorhamnose 3,5-epimerase